MNNDIIQFPTMVNPYVINSMDKLRAELERAQEERLRYFIRTQALSEALKGCDSVFRRLTIARIFGMEEDINQILDEIVETFKERHGAKNENPLS